MEDVIVDIVMRMKPPLSIGYTKDAIMRWRIGKAIELVRQESIYNLAGALANTKTKKWNYETENSK